MSSDFDLNAFKYRPTDHGKSAESQAPIRCDVIAGGNVGKRPPNLQPQHECHEQCIQEVWQQAIDQVDGDPMFPPELIHELRAADVAIVDSCDDWTDEDIYELWAERVAIIQCDGGISGDEAAKLAFQDILGQVGEKRMRRMVPNTQTVDEAKRNSSTTQIASILNCDPRCAITVFNTKVAAECSYHSATESSN